MAVVVAAGVAVQRLHLAAFVASVVYLTAAGGPLYALSRRRNRAFSEMLTPADLLLRRAFVWVLLGLVVLYDLLIAQAFALAVGTGVFTYVAGALTQSVRRHRTESAPSSNS